MIPLRPLLFCGLTLGLAVQNQGGSPLRVLDNRAFQVGEKLTFSIGWEFIDAGTAVMHVEERTRIGERETYRISATTNSNAFFSTLYKVRDRLETYVDAEGLYPLKYRKKTQEGDARRDFEVDFDHTRGRARIADADSGNSEVDVPVFVQDIISAFYFLRNQPMVIGQDIHVSAFDNGKVRDVSVKVVKKEKVSVTAGEFDCILVQTPVGPFSNRSVLNIWLTDDHRRVPVLMKSRIIIGSVRAELEKMEGV
jgi:hypothetical protein